jgi:homoserine kinase
VNATGRASATAFAPASVGNVAVGFDILGHTVAALGDRVRAVRRDAPGVSIRAIRGMVPDLPLEARRTPRHGRARHAARLALRHEFDLEIDKGIRWAQDSAGRPRRRSPAWPPPRTARDAARSQAGS